VALLGSISRLSGAVAPQYWIFFYLVSGAAGSGSRSIKIPPHKAIMLNNLQ